ncbi:hypothetical protein CMI37_32820 [Candidatus Pacearchaeota archaeon]|nr:hypothetical protein [Candidatus Pacearchaeota archaeon]
MEKKAKEFFEDNGLFGELLGLYSPHFSTADMTASYKEFEKIYNEEFRGIPAEMRTQNWLDDFEDKVNFVFVCFRDFLEQVRNKNYDFEVSSKVGFKGSLTIDDIPEDIEEQEEE